MVTRLVGSVMMNSQDEARQGRLLVVDDETTARIALAHALTLLGYAVHEAESGQQALDQLAANEYDLMVLDLRMPGIDGLEVMQYAARHYPDVLVVVLTAYATLDSAIMAVKIGAVDYLLKPSSIKQIAESIHHALAQRAEGRRQEHLLRTIADAVGALQGVQHEEVRRLVTPDHDAQTEARFLRCGALTLDRDKQVVFLAQHDVPDYDAALTSHETALLAYMMDRPDAVLSCRDLALHALGYEVNEQEARELIRPHISRLRKKIEPSGITRLIRNVRGKGYLLHIE